MKTIGIAGAGLIGRLLAWRLVNLGYEITLFDKDNKLGKMSAALTAAGMISPYSEVVSSESHVLDLGLQSLKIWPGLIDEIERVSSKKILYCQNGSLVIAHIQDEASYTEFKSKLNYKVSSSLKGAIELDNQGLAKLESEISSKFSRALYLSEEAHIDTHQLFAAMEIALLQKGVKWNENCSVTEVAANTIVTSNKKHIFDFTVDCRGLGAERQQHNLRGVRGETLRIRAPSVNISRPIRLMHPRYALYIVPHSKNEYVIGATSVESNDMSPITLRSCLELSSALYSVHCGFAEGHIIDTPVNCRPAYEDNLPKIITAQSYMSINGLYRHGYLWGPAIVDMAVRLLRDCSIDSLDHPELVANA